MKPQSIDRFINGESITDIASFNYYEGIEWCKIHNIPQTTDGVKMMRGQGFLVCAGWVLVLINIDWFPDMQRKTTVSGPLISP